ncbi:hypothetical protein DFH06DRAFT_1084908 [Mycena polygramma]|nr:hypothetical protein DFH06DRAFT_1084908 [Mycena polygramma]
MLCTTQPAVPLETSPADFPDGRTECLVTADVKRLILNTPGFPARLVRPASCKYRLAPVPGKGQGLFGTEIIRAGELILSERPLTLAPILFCPPIHFTKESTTEQTHQAVLYERERSLKLLFGRMHPENQAAYMALANSHKHDGSGPITGILRTNGFAVECLQTGKFSLEQQEKERRGVYNAVCKEISRLNHSCSPNTIAHFDISTFSFQLLATRNIAEGEELTLAYTGVINLTTTRQKALEPYGFQCTCAACLEPSTSDTQRGLIQCIKITNVDDGLVKLALIEEQGLQVNTQYCETLNTVMELFISNGDAETARMYAKKLAVRKWSAYAAVAQRYTTIPAIEAHPLWKKKNRRVDENLERTFDGLDLVDVRLASVTPAAEKK